jgi:hypothetical protein
MSNPENKIIIKDISSKVTNPREELMMKDKTIRKPFIFKGYTTEKERIKNIEYNNKLLYNIPDYPDSQSQRISKEKMENKKGDVYNFNIQLPKKYNTINSEDNIKIKNKEKNDNDKQKMSNNSLRKNIRTSSINNRNNHSTRRLSIAEIKLYQDLDKKNLIYQPQMRFRARTDLERVFDNLNYKSLNEKDRYIIEKQLKNIDLYQFKKPGELLELANKKTKKHDKHENKKYNVLPNPIIEEQKKEKERIKREKMHDKNQLFYDYKYNDHKLWARKDNLNREAKKFLSSYYYKTHFKATEEAQFEFKKQSLSQDNNIDFCLMIPNIFNDNYELINKNKKRLGILKLNNINKNKKKDIFNFDQDLLREEEESLKMSDYNKITKIYQNNPIYDTVRTKPNPEFMRNLSEMAFMKNEKENEIKIEDFDDSSANGTSDIYALGKTKKLNSLKSDENIHHTAKMVLGECNLYNTKNKYNNSFLKSRTGKTMITKGLSVNDFLQKYRLND